MLPTEEQVNGGIVAAAVLAMLLVALRPYGRHCRHPAVRFFVWGASIVFLPLTSSIISFLLVNLRMGQNPDHIRTKPFDQSISRLIQSTPLLYLLKPHRSNP
jgi:hypothetical protein